MQSNAGKCVFTSDSRGVRVYAALYVDDGFFLCHDKQILDKLVRIFGSEFDIVTSDFNHFIGMEITRGCDLIFVSNQSTSTKFCADLA